MNQIISMLSRSSDGAMLVDPGGTVLYWNKAAERLLGFKANEVVGRPCHDVMQGEMPSGETCICAPDCWIRKVVARGNGVRNYDWHTRTKTNQTVCLNISTLPVPTRKKGQFQSLFLFRDKSAQAKLRQAAGRLCALYQAAEEWPQVSAEHPAAPKPEAAAVGATPRAPDPPSLPFPLTKREREILELVAVGEHTRTIADRLCISPATVRNHLQHIFEKLGAHSRLQAVALAFHPGCNTASPAPSRERLQAVSST
jgi:DNA-binding CsgD family transcriptional regulator